MKRTGGIVAILAGTTGLVIAVVSTILSLMLAPIFTSNIGKIEAIGLLGAGAGLLCIAIVFWGIPAVRTAGISKKKARRIGIILLLCAVAASTLFFTMLFVIVMAQVVAGASMMLLDKESLDDARSLTPRGFRAETRWRSVVKNAGATVVIMAGLSGAIGAGYEIVVLLHEMAVYGWRALAFCAAIMALGAVATKAKGRLIGVLVILCAIAASLVFGSALVVVFMAQAVVGALLLLFGRDSKQPARSSAP